MALSQHSPTSAIVAQVRQHDPASVASDLWAFYPPLPGRNAEAMLRSVNCGYRELSQKRDPLDSRVLLPLVRQLRAYRPDVMHCHFVRANIYGRLAAKLAGVPVVINTLRGVDDYLVEPALSSRAVRFVERLTLPLVSRYVTVSEAVRRNAIATLRIRPEQIVTVMNAVDLGPFAGPQPQDRAQTRRAMDLDEDAIVLASIGELRPLKNHQLAIRLIGELQRRVKQPVQLVIAGEGDDRDALIALAAELGLQRSVRITGLLKDIPRLLRAVDVSVLFSLSEGLPRAIMESMACGLPCVVSDNGGNPEAVIDGETGFVRPLAAPNDIVHALQQLIEQPALRRKLGDSGRAVAFTRFSPARLATEYEALYRALLRERDHLGERPTPPSPAASGASQVGAAPKSSSVHA